MLTSDFDYELPPELIAQTPLEPRDHSRLMVCDRKTNAIAHRHFYDLPEYLKQGDALVINDTRVIPARLLGRKSGTHGAVEVLLLRRISGDTWESLVRPGARLRAGACIEFGGADAGDAPVMRGEILEQTQSGGRIIRFTYDKAHTFENMLDTLGTMPLPPYIKKKLNDPNRYQTVYASRDGSAAAPTAGLHFTPELLARLERMGVAIVKVLLHVGLGTFRPVTEEDFREHKMHGEYYELTDEAASAINAARRSGGRVVCVGTTTARVLETLAQDDGTLVPGSGETHIFIYPGVHVRAFDALVTNFHLPRSTLLMLVSAFWDREALLAAYRLAVETRYRFYSLGDAMLIGDFSLS